MDIEAVIAQRLKTLRTERGWSLDELAQHSGVSRAMISRIERQEASPTAGLLSKLADALAVTLSGLMSGPQAPRHQVSRRDAQPQWRDPQTGYLRRLVSPAGGEHDTDIVAIDLPAGAKVRYDAHTAPYEQQVLLLQGRLRLTVGGEALELNPGDCTRMPLDADHIFENPGQGTAHYLVVVRKAHSPHHPPGVPR
ncbi:helix-turn-helix domain-containing protein [Piscinibacter terrae]|uniref:XRE family transcriptional regulator n=1 Tax=Piscinibacter terrae TaxID=2496871 RepID=A0A3N7HJY7_9BURK|nr:XRE family transcriptional regulator [Albitalea terrae]RQP22388.1 XRE family transcriptional regulator [Albitalea terrae]